MTQDSLENQNRPNGDFSYKTAGSQIVPTEKKTNHWLHFEKNEIFLLLNYLFFGVAFANYEPYAPVWLSQIFSEDSFLIIGLVLVIPSIVASVGTFVWGFLADKFGAKKFVIIGLISYTLMFFCLIFTQSSLYFLIIVLFGYLIGSAQTGNFYALATKSVEKPKEIILAKIVMTIGISWSIVSPIVGYIYDHFENSMIIQLVIAIIACSISILFISFVKPKKVENKEEDVKIETKEKIALSPLPFVFAGLLVLIFFFQSTGGFWAYTSIYFLEHLNVEGIYYSIFLIAKTVLTIPLSFLLGKVKRTKMIGITAILFVGWINISSLIMVLFPTKWILILIVYSLPMFPLNSISFNFLITTITNKKRRATAFGISNTIGTIGYVLGILILGLGADNSPQGIEIMLTISLIYALLTLVTSILLYITKLRKDLVIKDQSDDMIPTN